MSNKKFYILFAIVIGVGILATIGHAIYIRYAYENSSIIQFIAREWWP